jgi:hypothetical protein
MLSNLSSNLDLAFYRARSRQCLELADLSRSVPAIKSRLEALARSYQQRIEELEGLSRASPPLVPDQRNQDSLQSISSTVDTKTLNCLG